MTKIFEDIYSYVHPIDANCNVYVFKDGPDLDFIDTGIGKLGINKWLWREIRRDGLEPRFIRNIFHTHLHFDHIQADCLFQKKATKNSVKIFYPELDSHRFNPNYSMIDSNANEIKNGIRDFPFNKISGLLLFAKKIFEPLVSYQTPSNLETFENGMKLQIGKYSAKTIFTGGHTEGHSFFQFNNENNILIFGDCGVVNEYVSNWKDVINSMCIAKSLNPDNLLGGHNALHLGRKGAVDDIRGNLNRFNGMVEPIIKQMRQGNLINLTDIGHRRVNWMIKIGLVKTWALMAIYSIGKYLENNGLGKIEADNYGDMWFHVTDDENKKDMIEKVRQIEKQESISYSEALISTLSN